MQSSQNLFILTLFPEKFTHLSPLSAIFQHFPAFIQFHAFFCAFFWPSCTDVVCPFSSNDAGTFMEFLHFPPTYSFADFFAYLTLIPTDFRAYPAYFIRGILALIPPPCGLQQSRTQDSVSFIVEFQGGFSSLNNKFAFSMSAVNPAGICRSRNRVPKRGLRI